VGARLAQANRTNQGIDLQPRKLAEVQERLVRPQRHVGEVVLAGEVTVGVGEAHKAGHVGTQNVGGLIGRVRLGLVVGDVSRMLCQTLVSLVLDQLVGERA
jgi:hypothetical protein